MTTTKKKTKNKHFNRNIKLIVAIVLFIFFIIFIKNLKSNSNNIKNDKIQLLYNNENITAKLRYELINDNNQIYMSFEDLKSIFDENIYFEEKSETFITTSQKKLGAINKNSDNITINGSVLNAISPYIEKEGINYLAISEMKNIYDYEFKFIENANIAIVESMDKEKIVLNTKKKVNLKENEKFFSNTVEKLDKGEEVVLIKQEDNKSKVRTENGNIGYINYNQLENLTVLRENFKNIDEPKEIQKYYEYNLTNDDISTFEKRQNIANYILQQTVKSDNMYVKIIYENDTNKDFERFKIETSPILRECGIKIFY